MCCPTKKVVKSMYSDAPAPAVVPYPSGHDLINRLAVKRLGCTDSHFVSLFLSKFGLTSYRTYLPRSLVWNLFSKGIKYQEYILYATRRGAVSGITLKSNLYVFLACSVYGAKCSTGLLLLLRAKRATNR